MTKLLFIEASPRGGESKSIQIAETYLSVLLANNPDLDVDRLKLWEADLPAFDGDKVAAKMNVIVGQEQNAAQKTAWDQIVEIAGLTGVARSFAQLGLRPHLALDVRPRSGQQRLQHGLGRLLVQAVLGVGLR